MRLAFNEADLILADVRKTKIICTLGPATEKPETLRQLMDAGADVFRLNMSHAKHDWVREIVPRIRKIAAQLRRPVAILLDTQGPAIRTGELKTDLRLKVGRYPRVHRSRREERGEVFRRRELRRTDQRHLGRRHRPGRQRRHAPAGPGKKAQPDSLQSAYARHARLAPPHQSPRRAGQPAAAHARRISKTSRSARRWRSISWR